MNRKLYRVLAPHFVAGFEAQCGLIVSAAPILNWAVGRHLFDVMGYAARKNWVVEEVRGET